MKISIIGAGPASLMVATQFVHSNHEVTIYEQKNTPGRKFLVAGKGGFNLTGGFNDIFFNTTDDQSIFILLQNILKTISFGINSFLNISQKIEDIKSG